MPTIRFAIQRRDKPPRERRYAFVRFDEGHGPVRLVKMARYKMQRWLRPYGIQ